MGMVRSKYSVVSYHGTIHNRDLIGVDIHYFLVVDVSMLARLMDTLNLYKKNASGKYNDAVLVKLLNNYRSHSEILKVPNKLFYDDELIAKGEYTTLAIGWHHLPNPKVPIIFHNVIGRDEREKTSPRFDSLLHFNLPLHSKIRGM